jgi:hypothetical protein
MPTPFAPERRPLSLDVNDDSEVHDWVKEMVTAQVIARREPQPAIHLLFDGHEEVLEWTRVHQVDPEADLAATWQVVAARKGVERRLLVLRMQGANGGPLACIFEQVWEDGAPVGWWFALRPYDVVEGIGQLSGPAWQEQAGVGPAPGLFARMLTPGPDARPAQLLTAKKPEPQVFMQTGEAPDESPLPASAMQMTEQTAAVVISALETEGFRHLVVFLLRGRTWEKWLLGDSLPTAADDMVRWICGREGQPDAVATAEGVLGNVDGKPERVIRIVAEMGGKRAERLIIMLPKPGKPEDVVPGRWMARELGAVPEDDGWIGVKPLTAGEIVAYVMGPGTPG